ncbi:hypothetical protein IU433_00555 [Nocardia puris]|uniref:Excreted virulence factor EspC (Type VII ESX diderm) n=1 Tax=Nocardia puris TaxID=208602 RepID=A0A366DUC6_9NOCA|nr:type VII secretion target [Nocardia puris]MBF6210274.1 hypothetical protein [Nocardia puris]MBF6367350.1 hypothetical protein [Nocardia puris]MBF6457535.1 hypothetical protein [Nocardia puris]RBO93693.1 excreted virulence factor EspC (type VII ESX diderm) [Nocardia puris]
MDTLKLDPAAMAAYSAMARTVAEQLASAASAASGAVNPQKLDTDLGLIGAEFVARFTSAVQEHTQALSTASQLVSAYDRVLRDYDERMRAGDASTARALSRTEEELS